MIGFYMTIKLVVNGLKDIWLKNEEKILKGTVWLGHFS